MEIYRFLNLKFLIVGLRWPQEYVVHHGVDADPDEYSSSRSFSVFDGSHAALGTVNPLPVAPCL